MKKIILILIIFVSVSIFAENAGSFTRLQGTGPEYIAIGGAAEAVTDDVFSMYWNPAGLVQLAKKKLSPEENVREKAKEGDVEQITEEELENFSKPVKKNFFQFGVSGAVLDNDRNTAFLGFAMNIGKNVIGIGQYVIYSPNIDKRDESGNKIGDVDYISAVSYISYSHYMKTSSIGITFKPLLEKIDDARYVGGAVDVGYQAEFFQFLRIGIVLQDLGIGMYPYEPSSGINKTYEFGKPTIRGGAAVAPNNSDFTICGSIIKEVESEDYLLNWGVQYYPSDVLAISFGMNSGNLTAGVNVEFTNFELAYAFAFDNIDAGYNNYISLTMVF